MPALVFLGLEEGESIDEVGGMLADDLDGALRLRVASGPDRNDEPALPSGGLVIRKVRHLVHERELDRSKQPGGRAVALATAVECCGSIVAGENLDCLVGDPHLLQRGNDRVQRHLRIGDGQEASARAAKEARRDFKRVRAAIVGRVAGRDGDPEPDAHEQL